MADIVDRQTRSRMMSGIRARNTEPELAVRKFLFAAGLRYRLHVRTMPGHPDIVLPRYRAVVQVHGCFWHQHPGCKFAYVPKSRPHFWIPKLAANVARDASNAIALRKLGWRVFVVWECHVNERILSGLVQKLRKLDCKTHA